MTKSDHHFDYTFSESATPVFSFLRFIELFIILALLGIIIDLVLIRNTNKESILLIMIGLIFIVIIHSWLRTVSAVRISNSDITIHTKRLQRKHDWSDIKLVYFPKIVPGVGGIFIPLVIFSNWMIYYYQIRQNILPSETINEFRFNLRKECKDNKILFI